MSIRIIWWYQYEIWLQLLVLMFDRFFKIFLLNRIECIIISNNSTSNKRISCHSTYTKKIYLASFHDDLVVMMMSPNCLPKPCVPYCLIFIMFCHQWMIFSDEQQNTCLTFFSSCYLTWKEVAHIIFLVFKASDKHG